MSAALHKRNSPKLESAKKDCDHSVVMKDMCALCGENLRTKDGLPGERTKRTDARVAMIHSIPELQITVEEAKRLGAADEENVVKQRRLVLLVDLDQTLVHTTNEEVDPNIKDVYHFQLYGSNSPWYHVRLRPNTKHFLQTMSSLYEMHICTFGARMYAHKIAAFLDPDGAIFGHRILSRDECFDPALKTANLKALFPCGDRLVCVIDDREDVWNFATNVIQVKPYRYFKNTGDINAPSGFTKTERNTDKHFQFAHPKSKQRKSTKKKKQIVVEETEDERVVAEIDVDASADCGDNSNDDDDDDDDDYLYYLEEILRRIHTAFYQLYDQMRESDRPPDLHSVIPYVKLKVLKNVNLVFSSVIPTNARPEDTIIYNLAKSFGAVVQENIVGGTKPDETSSSSSLLTTHLVAGKWGTNKVREAQAIGNLKIVSPQWLWCCAERWERVEEKLFPLPKDADFTKLYSNLEGNVRRNIRRENKDASNCSFFDSQTTSISDEGQTKGVGAMDTSEDLHSATKMKSEDLINEQPSSKRFKSSNSTEFLNVNEETIENPHSFDDNSKINQENIENIDNQDSNDKSDSSASSTTNEGTSDSNDDEIAAALEREMSEQKEDDEI